MFKIPLINWSLAEAAALGIPRMDEMIVTLSKNEKAARLLSKDGDQMTSRSGFVKPICTWIEAHGSNKQF